MALNAEKSLKESVIEAIFENALFIVMLYHAFSLVLKRGAILK